MECGSRAPAFVDLTGRVSAQKAAGGKRVRRDSFAITVVGQRTVIRMSSAMIRFKKRGGAAGVIFNQLQILGAGLIYSLWEG